MINILCVHMCFVSIFSTNIHIVQWCHLCQCYQCPLPQKRLYQMYSIQMKITYPRQQSPSSSSRQLPKSIPGGGLSTTWVSVDIPNHKKKSAIKMKYSKQKSNKKIQMIFIILDIDSYYQSSALLLSFLPEYLFLVIVLIDWCKGYWTIFGQYWSK